MEVRGRSTWSWSCPSQGGSPEVLIGRKGDVSEGSGENGSGVGERVAEARIVAVRAGVSGCAVGAQWWG